MEAADGVPPDPKTRAYRNDSLLIPHSGTMTSPSSLGYVSVATTDVTRTLCEVGCGEEEGGAPSAAHRVA
jgi:protein-L-isoaspartate O-methyltransferase